MSSYQLETMSPPALRAAQGVHEITTTYDYEACCGGCCCCIDREQSVLGQGVIFITRFFGCCGCHGREEHIIKTEHVEKVIVQVPNSGECICVTPVKASIQTRNGSHTPLRLHRTDAKSFRADVQKLMTDQPVEPHDV